jgi:hypothetical protein
VLVRKRDLEAPLPCDVDIFGLKRRTRDAQHVQVSAEGVGADERCACREEAVIEQGCQDGARP